MPPRSVSMLDRIGRAAHSLGKRVFLVGGPVRDLLLRRHGLDMDLVAEGDAVSLGASLARRLGGSLTARSQFGTVKLVLEKHPIDLATSRREAYSSPGSLPTVFPGPIEEDLARRDFSINAVAASLSPEDWGTVLDPQKGRRDMDLGVIRALHPDSFRDDATRIFRAFRYEQRLGFVIESHTLNQLQASLHYVNNISGDRLRQELERVFHEEAALDVLARAAELDALHAIDKGLSFFDANEVREAVAGRPPSQKGMVCLAFLAYYLPETESFISRLNMPPKWAKITRDVASARAISAELDRQDVKPSEIYRYLRRFSNEALEACALLERSTTVKRHIRLYLDDLLYTRPCLGGDDLQQMGIQEGPMIGDLLAELKRARLDGEVTDREQEVAFIHGMREKRSQLN